MRSTLKLAVLVLCVPALAGTVSPAKAEPCLIGGGAWDQGLRLERLAACLDLTDEQIDAIERIREERSSKRADFQREITRIRNELRGEMLEDSPDIAELKRLIAIKEEIRASMQVSRLETRLALREILTPEQRDRLTMLRSSRRQGGFLGEGRGHRHGRMDRGRGWRDGSGPHGRFDAAPRHRRVW